MCQGKGKGAQAPPTIRWKLLAEEGCYMACLAAPALAALTHAGVGRSRVQVVHVRVPVRVRA